MLILAAVAGLSIIIGASAQMRPAGFYDATPQEIAGTPGTLIRHANLPGASLDATAYRILYRSTGLHGEPIAVSGVLIVLPGPAPNDGRTVIAWGHPTSGVVPRCAPSRAVFVFQTIQGLREMIRRGHVVVATDYPGLGTPGPHPYLVGVSEGRAVMLFWAFWRPARSPCARWTAGKRLARSRPTPIQLTWQPDQSHHHFAGDEPIRPFPHNTRRYRSQGV